MFVHLISFDYVLKVNESGVYTIGVDFGGQPGHVPPNN